MDQRLQKTLRGEAILILVFHRCPRPTRSFGTLGKVGARHDRRTVPRGSHRRPRGIGPGLPQRAIVGQLASSLCSASR